MKRKDHYKNCQEVTTTIDQLWIQRVIKLVPDSNLRILDVGCGDGTFSTFLKQGSNEVWGIEISEMRGARAQSKIDKVIIQDAEREWKVPANYFNIITMFAYLEHVFDYNFQLCQARLALKRNGYLIISSPNLSILERLRLLFGRIPAYASSIEHIRLFTKPILFKLRC